MEHPTASIVIIAWNEEATIGACLESACQQDYPKIVEIIVVDGNSTDGTHEIVHEWEGRDHRVRLVEEDPNRTYRGPAAARKLGVSLATGEYVQLFNGDVTVEPDYVSRLMEFALETNLSGTAGLRWNKDPTLLEDFVNIRYWIYSLDNPSAIENPPFLSSDGVLYRRDDLLSVGSYDETLVAAEDCDIGYRITSNDGRLRYLSGPLIYHSGRHYRTFTNFYRQQEWYGRGAAQLATKYPFRYAAEQSKVRNFVIYPVAHAGLWIALSVVLGRVSPLLALLPQIWLIRNLWGLFQEGWKIYRDVRNAPTPTRVRTLCCCLFPVFNWTRYLLYTVSYWRNVPPPAELHRRWQLEPFFSSLVQAANDQTPMMTSARSVDD